MQNTEHHEVDDIAVGITDRPPETGVDTEADLLRVNDILRK